MSSKTMHSSAGGLARAELAQQICEYAARVSDLRARQQLVRERAGLFEQLYEEVSQGIEELRMVEEELRARDKEIYQAYAAVVRERRRYKDLFALSPDAHLITDQAGVVLEANVRAQELLGLPIGYLRGKPLVTFVSGSGQRRAFRTWFSEALSAGTPKALTVALKAQEREAFAAELRVIRVVGETPSASVWMWTIVDMSEKLVARRDAELAGVVRVSGDAIIILSRDGIVATQNPASQLMHGEIVGRSIRELISPEHRHSHDRTMANLSRTAHVATIDSVHVRAGAAPPIDVSVTYSLIDEPTGSPVRVALVIRDISPRKELELRLREHAAEREQADRRKTEFIGLLAHELRNPLNVIVTAMQALSQTDDAAVHERASATSLRNARHMARLIDELLDLSRISRDELPITPRLVAVQDIVRRAVGLAGPRVEEKRHDLRVDVPETPLVVQADPTRLTQAISNVLDNAAKYTPHGGTVRLSVQAADHEVQIRVQDNGAGIPPELLDRVFEPFVQGRAPRSSDGGLGIGLALVRRIVELHGGIVRAESEGAGLGSRFTITFPLGEQPPNGEELASDPFAPVADD